MLIYFIQNNSRLVKSDSDAIKFWDRIFVHISSAYSHYFYYYLGNVPKQYPENFLSLEWVALLIDAHVLQLINVMTPWTSQNLSRSWHSYWDLLRNCRNSFWRYKIQGSNRGSCKKTETKGQQLVVLIKDNSWKKMQEEMQTIST